MRRPAGIEIAVTGMLTLAVAQGIGRFAFTPMLPIMQSEAGLSLAAGSWLASANYAGYLAGALSAIWLRLPAAATVRWSLAAIACLTAAMASTHNQTVWVLLRGGAGIASAWAMVFASAWTMHRLAAMQASGLAGIVFGGVGLGIALAGVLCVLFLHFNLSLAEDWIALGVLALVLTALCWRTYVGAGVAPEAAPPPAGSAGAQQKNSRESIRMVVCYGLYGFGYIIPATYLPAMARQAIADPSIFGWAWPIFGLAALFSTLAAGWLSRHISSRIIWAACHIVMAAGVIIPVLWTGIGGIVLSALCVGGTFVVITLVGMQEARRVAPAGAASLMAALTAAFGAGQICGPVVVGFAARAERGLNFALIAASVLLVLSAVALLLPPAGSDRRASRGYG